MTVRRTGPSVFLIAGEPSGDNLGSRLVAALSRATVGAARFHGVGGPRMIAQGLDSLFPLDDLALFGVFELLPKLPNLARRLAQTVEAIHDLQPDVVVTIDSPGFCFRVARRLRAAGGNTACIPLIHYVAPTVWAWRPERAAKVAALYDHLLALLPFEPPYFEREGLPCTFVGHPVIETGAGHGNGARFRRRYGLGEATTLITVLPGSRQSEVKTLLPIFRSTIAMLKGAGDDLAVAIPTVPQVADRVRMATAGWPLRTLVTMDDNDKYDAFAASRAAVAASGTVALELALAGVPNVIAYRLHPITVWLYRRVIKVRFANLVNIMHDRAVVPELLQENCRPSKLAAALAELLVDEAAGRRQRAGFTDVADWLGVGGASPSERAAETVLAVLDRHRR